jgi:hypothetical protein
LPSRTLLAVVVLTTLAGCGSSGDRHPSVFGDACRRGSVRVARIQPVVTLADAAPAVRQALALEQAVLLDVRRAAGPDDRLALQVARSIRSARAFLASVESPYAQGTMSPLRTSVPGARRVVATARELIRVLCARARS